MLEIPNVLLGIQKMIQIRTPSKLQDVDVQMHMSKFYYTLAGILNHPNLPGTYHKARVITFNGELKWLYSLHFSVYYVDFSDHYVDFSEIIFRISCLIFCFYSESIPQTVVY